MDKVLVTGGAGYFGSLLSRRLLNDGHHVRVFDLVDADTLDVEMIRGDIRDRSAVERACLGVDVVYHNVAQVPLARDRELFDSVNCGGTENIVDAAYQASVRKVVHTSSSAVYGVPLKNPIAPGVATRPGEAYGRAKVAAEEVIARCVRDRGQDVTIIRPRTVLGHGRLGIFQILFQWVREGRRIPVLGRGDNLYQFIHADDLADACVRAAVRPGSAVYNIGTDRFGTMRQLLEALCDHAGSGSTIYSLPLGPSTLAMRVAGALGLVPFAPYHAMMYGRSFYFDLSSAVDELDWRPRWSNHEMICDSYDWFLANRETLAEGQSLHKSPVREGFLLSVLKRLS